jgi:DNA repair exonuclease SbcCD ATPase subunit
MMSQGLTAGWAAWWELWNARATALRRLRQAYSMLHSPDLSNFFVHWASLAVDIKRAQELARAHRESQSLDHQLRQARFEAGQLTMVKTAQLDEIRNLKDKVSELSEQQREMKVLLDAADRYREENEALKDETAMSQEAAQAAELSKADLEKTVERQLRANQDLLERLLEAQRAKFDEDLAAFKKEAWNRAETEEKERRVDVMRERIARRMLNRTIARGWSAWVDHWNDRCHIKTCHLKAVRHVGKNEKIGAFGAWWHLWDSIRRAKLARAESEIKRISLMQEDYARVKAELAEAERERLELREKLARLDSSVVDLSKLKDEQAKVHKEERIELLYRNSMRRIQSLALYQGWLHWYELWRARSNALRHLRKTCGRLKTPMIAWAFRQLVEEWKEAKATSEMSTWQRKEAELTQAKAQLEEELQTVKDQLQAQTVSFEAEKKAALAKQATELTGTLEERLALKDQEAKDARVDALTKQTARRIMYGSLGNAFAAWVDAWESRNSAFDQLRRAKNMLKAPEMLLAFQFWAADTAELKRQAEIAQIEKEARSVEAELRRARFDNDQMRMVQAKNDDEIKYLKDKLSDLAVQFREQAEAFEGTSGLRGEIQGLRGQLSAALEAAEESEKRRLEAEDDIGKQRRENQKLLEKLLAEQRAGFLEEVSSMRRMRESAVASKHRSEEEVNEAMDQMNAAKAALREKERELTKARDEAEGWVKVVEEKEQSASRLEQQNVALSEQLHVAREEVEKGEEKLVTLRNHYMAIKPPPPVEAPPEEKKSPKEPPAGKKRENKKGSVLGNIDLDEGPDARPVKDQLAEALAKSSARVLDLFREWDKNGDGEVDRAEFHKAIPALGLDVPKEDIDELFNEWDKDGGGSITFRELQTILKRRSPASTISKVKSATTALKAMKPPSPIPKPGED